MTLTERLQVNISILKSKYIPVILVVLVGFIIGKLAAEQSYFVPLLLFFSMGALVIYCFSRYNSSLLAIFLIAFSLRFASSFIFSNSFWYDDEKTYHHFGILISRRLSEGQGLAGEGFYISDIYYALNGILYHLFGENTLVGRALNVFVGSLIPFMLYHISRKIYKNGKVTRLVLYLSVFAPPLIIFSGVQLKESLISFLIVTSVWSMMCLRDPLASFMVSLLSIVFLGMLRLPLALLTGATILLQKLLLRRRKSGKLRVRQLIIATFIVATILFVFLKYSPLGDHLIEKYHRPELIERHLAETKAIAARFIDKEDVFSPFNIIFVIVRSVFSPSPLRFLVSPRISVYIETLTTGFWYLIVPLWLTSFLITWREKEKIVINFIPIFIFIIASLSFLGPFPEPLRYRIASFPLFTLIAAHGFYETKRREKIVKVWIFLIVIFHIIYHKIAFS